MPSTTIKLFFVHRCCFFLSTTNQSKSYLFFSPKIPFRFHFYAYPPKGHLMKTSLLMILPLIMLLTIPVTALSETRSYTCIYPSYSDGKRIQKVEKEFKLIFIVDTSKKTVYMVGNMGSTEVSMSPVISGGFTFIEITGGGNVMTTSIDSKLNSVHSRNSIIDGELLPSQYYGVCKHQD